MIQLSTTSPYFEKDPLAEKRITVDWTDWLAWKPGVTLVSATVSVTVGSGLTVTSPATISGATATTEASGGTIDTSYEVIFAATMSNGEVDVQRLIVRVRKIPVGL